MFPSTRRIINFRPQTTTTQQPYFLIVMTNYPNLLQRAHEHQPPNQYWQPHQRYHPGGMLIPGVRVHFGTIFTDEHERLLYNTFRFQLQQIVRTYLHQTRQSHPIYLVFDLSEMNFQL